MKCMRMLIIHLVSLGWTHVFLKLLNADSTFRDIGSCWATCRVQGML